MILSKKPRLLKTKTKKRTMPWNEDALENKSFPNKRTKRTLRGSKCFVGMIIRTWPKRQPNEREKDLRSNGIKGNTKTKRMQKRWPYTGSAFYWRPRRTICKLTINKAALVGQKQHPFDSEF